jgi:TIR domain
VCTATSFSARTRWSEALKGLVLLRGRLDAWNRDEAAPPYTAEVRDLDWMIKWSRERMAGAATHGDFYSVSYGSLRYLKAGAVLLVLEAEEQLRHDLGTLPAGVITARRARIARMKEMCEEGVFAALDPADCLWEVAPAAPIRTPAPSLLPDGTPPWDIFMSHASEDKEPFVRSLANALVDSGVRVWLDDFVLKLGDSLRRSIERGLRASRYGVVVLSPRFFEKEWPQKELDGMAALEVDGRKVILPIWHDVGVAEVRAYSPILADRVAIRSDRGLDGVVMDILEVVQPQPGPRGPGT